LAPNDVRNDSTDEDDIDDEEYDGMIISRSPDSSDSEDEKSDNLVAVNGVSMSTVNAPDSTGEPTADTCSEEIKVD
jgi:hypothetical protein